MNSIKVFLIIIHAVWLLLCDIKTSLMIKHGWLKRRRVKARDKKHLIKIIEREMNYFGEDCNLNHIDVSDIKDMGEIFRYSPFNGNISKWDVSKVEDMSYMFEHSLFNGNISKWDVSNVIKMNKMFNYSKFNGNINRWNPENLEENENMMDYQVQSYKMRDNVFVKKRNMNKLPVWVSFENRYVKKRMLEGQLKEKLKQKIDSKNNFIKI